MNNNHISRVISRSTEVCNKGTDTEMVGKEAQESSLRITNYGSWEESGVQRPLGKNPVSS